MKISIKMIPVILLFLMSCKQNETSKEDKVNSQKIEQNDSIVFETKYVTIKKLASDVYQHISFLQTDDYGKVSCNGMIIKGGNDVVIFDTPATVESSQDLINFLVKEMKVTIKAVVPTHYHEDCIAGLDLFRLNNIDIFASKKTILKLNTLNKNTDKIKDFDEMLTIKVGNEEVVAQYFGPGHTTDNIVGYYPKQNALFGGCLIKELGANKGHLGDAEIKEWTGTVEKLKRNYPEIDIVIPGHGKAAGTKLLDYTIELFRNPV